MASRIKYNYSLFDNNTDPELAVIYNVSRQAINYQRRKRNSDKNSAQIQYEKNTLRINNLILEYIKSHINNVNVAEFKKLNKSNSIGKSTKSSQRSQLINRERFLKVAEDNAINIQFVTRHHDESSHGMCCYKKCNCQIGKLASNIRGKFKRYEKYKRTSFKVIDYLANKYIEIYKKISILCKPGKNKLINDFYTKILNEVDLIKNENIETYDEFLKIPIEVCADFNKNELTPLILDGFSLENAEIILIKSALEKFITRKEAANALGISEHSLYRRLIKHNLTIKY